ncbi:FimV/HubP family polar landmark protein [Thiohalospira sp.]|uniref:FimV/HubP family polar landmark protein n=1 Tax=Thiohalospira sp. TaxID=3080549 RepID=UPI00397F4B88
MRVSAAILALAGLLTPLAAAGVGLGEIEVDSYIDEPFEGRIELTDVERDELDRIRARLAPEADFRDAGMERTPTAGALDFEPVWEEGRAYLRVTTSRPVERAFLDLLVELEWPAGREVREYTVLLDPPDTTDEESASVDAPAAEADTAASRPEQETDLEYGRVEEGDRLWDIAEELRQRAGGDVTTEQVAMALLRDNPEAFQGDNVNRLMAGYVLRIDDTDSLGRVGAEEAESEFWRQYRAWQDFRQQRAGEATERPSREAGAAGGDADDEEAGDETADAEGAGNAEGQDAPSGLSLEGPEAMAAGEAPGSGGEAEDAEDSRVEELSDELDEALAEADSRREGNEALRERLAAMEEQLQSMERLLEFDSSELAALQEGAEEEPATSDEFALFLDLLNRHPQWVGVAGGLLILLLALVWVAARRHAGAGRDAQPEPRRRRVRAEGEQAAAEEHAPRSEDPVTEADIYFSMGRYAEAVEVLEKAIAHHPRHAEYRRRLAEIHHAHGNREAFLREARSMRQDLGESAPMEWARVAALGATMAPDDPLFARPSEGESDGGPAAPEGAAEPGPEPQAPEEPEATPSEEDEERIDASLEDEFAELMGEEDHRAEWDEALGTAEPAPGPASGEEAAGESGPGEPAAEDTPIDLEAQERVAPEEPAPAGAPAESAETVAADDIPVVDLDLAEDWVEGSPEAAFAHAEAESGAPEKTAIEEGEAAERGGEEEEPPVIDLEEPESAPRERNEESGTPMDAAELQSAYDDLMADEAAESAPEVEPASGPEPEPEPEPDSELESEPEPEATAGSEGTPETGAADAWAAEEPETPEGLHPLEADESAAWDEFEDDVADLLNDVDEVGTKLDLARAYIDMGDAEGARGILEEVVEEGNEEQQQEARSLLDQSQG